MSDQIMTRRVTAAQAAVDAFKEKPLVWGKCDCAKLASFTLKALGSKKAGLARYGAYASPVSARRALRKGGFTDLAAWMDSLGYLRIPPASALPADILGFGHPDQILTVGLAVAVGNGRVLAFADNGDGVHRCYVAPPTMDAAEVEYFAWRTF